MTTQPQSCQQTTRGQRNCSKNHGRNWRHRQRVTRSRVAASLCATWSRRQRSTALWCGVQLDMQTSFPVLGCSPEFFLMSSPERPWPRRGRVAASPRGVVPPTTLHSDVSERQTRLAAVSQKAQRRVRPRNSTGRTCRGQCTAPHRAHFADAIIFSRGARDLFAQLSLCYVKQRVFFYKKCLSLSRIMSHSHSALLDLHSSLLLHFHRIAVDHQPPDPRTAGLFGRMAIQSPLILADVRYAGHDRLCLLRGTELRLLRQHRRPDQSHGRSAETDDRQEFLADPLAGRRLRSPQQSNPEF